MALCNLGTKLTLISPIYCLCLSFPLQLKLSSFDLTEEKIILQSRSCLLGLCYSPQTCAFGVLIAFSTFSGPTASQRHLHASSAPSQPLVVWNPCHHSAFWSSLASFLGRAWENNLTFSSGPFRLVKVIRDEEGPENIIAGRNFGKMRGWTGSSSGEGYSHLKDENITG